MELKLARGEHTGWWLQAMAYTYTWSPTAPAAGTPALLMSSATR